MAGKRRRSNGTWEYVFKKSGLLDKPIYMTFSSEVEGDAYAARLETLLTNNIIPHEHQPAQRVMSIDDLDREYQREAHPSVKDVMALRVIVRKWGDVKLGIINAAWVDNWIAEMKRVERLAPATVRARVGALARCTDWGMRKGYVLFPDHPLRSLPDGYSQYSKLDAALAGGKREDVERDRRLEAGEYERILAVLDAQVIPRRQRDFRFPHPAALRCLFVLAGTGIGHAAARDVYAAAQPSRFEAKNGVSGQDQEWQQASGAANVGGARGAGAVSGRCSNARHGGGRPDFSVVGRAGSRAGQNV